MQTSNWLPRRVHPALAAVAAFALLASACGPTTPAAAPTSAPAPTAAPAAKPTEAPKPAASPSAASQPAASPVAASKPSGTTPTLPKPEKTSIKLGHSTLEASSVTYPFARDMGLFKKYGLDNVELFFNEGDAKALQALISGGVDASAQGVSVALSSQLTDTPVTAAALTVTTLTDDLVAVKDIKSAADLKGKRVAVSAFGGTSHGSVLLSLKGLGLTANDVTIVQIGGQSARIAALKAGSVAAAPVDIVERENMKKEGFNILISLPDTPLDYGRNGLVMRQEFIDKNPNTVLALVAALLEAQQLLYSDTDKAVDAFQKWAQIQDRAAAEKTVKQILPYMRRDMRWSKEGFELARDVLATQDPAMQKVEVTKAYTYQFLDKLKDMGFNQAVGVPAPR